MEQDRRWIEILIIPILIGLVIAIIQFGLPKIFAEDKEISYTIEDPIKYIDSQQISDVDVEVTVNGEPVKSLFIYKVKIWNSGDLSIRDIPVSLIFDDTTDFKIISIIHDTTPKYEFGDINETRADYSIRFIFSLLNPGDADTITIITNKIVGLNLYAKSEGLSLKISKDLHPMDLMKDKRVTTLLAFIISTISVLLTRVSLPKKKESHERKNMGENNINETNDPTDINDRGE